MKNFKKSINFDKFKKNDKLKKILSPNFEDLKGLKGLSHEIVTDYEAWILVVRNNNNKI